MLEPTQKPTQNQIDRCELFGWQYQGDGIFVRGGQIGWFTQTGFYKEAMSGKAQI